MTVHVKRNGEWIDADQYEVGDKFLADGRIPAVVHQVRVDRLGCTHVEAWLSLTPPLDFVFMQFKQAERMSYNDD